MKLASVIAALAFAAPAAALAANNWTYYAADAADNPSASSGSEAVACVADGGGWVIAATYDAAKSPREISLGAVVGESEDHVLDLRGMSVGGTAISALTLPNDGSWKSSRIKEFYASGVTALGKVFDGCPSVRVVEVASDTVTEYNTKEFVGGCTALGRLVLDCPKLTHYRGPNLFSGIVASNDVQDVIMPWTVDIDQNSLRLGLSNLTGSLVLTNLTTMRAYDTFYEMAVTNVYVKWLGTTLPQIGSQKKAKRVVFDAPNALTAGSISYLDSLEMTGEEFLPPWIQDFPGKTYRAIPLTGNIAMTNLTTVTKDPSQGAGVFWGGTKLSSAELSGPLKDFAAPWTEYDSPLERASLNLPNLTNTVVGAKTGAISLKEDGVLEIFGAPWGEHVTTNLLARFAVVPKSLSAPTNLTLRCSKKQGWKDWAQDYADDFPRSRAPEGCFGVWREPYGTGTRGAWMVHMPQDTDPRTGAILIVR